MESPLKVEVETCRISLGIVDPGPLEVQVVPLVEPLFTTNALSVLKTRLQLGLLSSVKTEWSNAVHTRFDHSVGVVAKCIVVSDLINNNTMSSGTPKLSLKDVLELAAAAALHDCGHLPISHASERALLSFGESKMGARHEDRIIPLLLEDDEYLADFKKIVIQWPEFDNASLNRIASLLYPGLIKDRAPWPKEFIWPKRAVQQLLSSELDMDRLDYIVRDARTIGYKPVTELIDRGMQYVKGLTLLNTKVIGEGRLGFDNVELCLSEEYLHEAFYTLVCRVLLYKYVYFSQEVRGFEGTLTYLLTELLHEKVFVDLLRLITTSDRDFIDNYLTEIINDIADKQVAKELSHAVEILQKNMTGSFMFECCIKEANIKNPRLREEFVDRLNQREYIEQLKSMIIEKANSNLTGSQKPIPSKYLLFDIFSLRSGGGDFLVQKKDAELKTLLDYMNGSNMHRLCSEDRLDIYIKTGLEPAQRKHIMNSINTFCES